MNQTTGTQPTTSADVTAARHQYEEAKAAFDRADRAYQQAYQHASITRTAEDAAAWSTAMDACEALREPMHQARQNLQRLQREYRRGLARR